MVYETMKKSMAPLRIYSQEAEALDRELKVYSAEIELLYDELDAMFKERFISTAEDMGLTVYEELFGPERSDFSVEERRRMLTLRTNLGEGDFTLSGIGKALESLGLSYVISELPELESLNISAVTEDYSQAEQAFIESEVSKIIPLHLEFQITFNTMTWEQIDAEDRTFGEIDSLNLSWHELDTRTE